MNTSRKITNRVYKSNYISITLLLFVFCAVSLKAQMVFEDYTGPVTDTELQGFKDYINTFEPNAWNGGNSWVYGNPGKAIEACGLMFEATGDMEILDRMVYFCDTAIAGRNDLAPAESGGQKATWTGNIDPVWPSSAVDVEPAGGGVEQGQVLSHIAACAKLILETPSIWNETVGIGDKHNFGTTYKERALRYIEECDYVIDNWILPYFIRTTDNNKYYFPEAPNTYKPGEPAPWNQAWMLTNAFVRLTQCHLLLGDDADRVSLYDSIAQPNIDWFMESLVSNTSPSGSDTYLWLYSLAQSNYEDANHFAYDAEGLWIAYDADRYGLTFDELLPFANTYFDIILATVTDGVYAGRVDGTTGSGNSGGDNYVRDEYVYLTEFRPEEYNTVVDIESGKNKIYSSAPITARLLWERNRRQLSDDTIPEAPTDLTAEVISPNLINLSWTDNSDNELSFQIQRSDDNGATWEFADSVNWNHTTYSDASVDSSTTYQYRVTAKNSYGSSAYTDIVTATTLRGLPIAPPANLQGTVISPEQIDLLWEDSSDNEDKYRIERSEDEGTTWDSLAVLPADSTAYSDFEVEHSTTYQYRVRGENRYGYSEYSDTLTISTGEEIIYYKGRNLVLNQTATASNVYKEREAYDGAKAVDGSYSTRWATDGNLSFYWLEIDLDTTVTFNKTISSDYRETVTDYSIQYWDGENWEDAFSTTGMGTEKADEFSSVTSDKIRLYIDTTWSGPSIYEFEVYNEQIVLSKGKTATASSTDSIYAASNAVDEDSTYWSASDNTYPQWFKVDLDSVKYLTEAAIDWLETDSVSYQYTIEVSNDDENYTNAVDNSGNTEAGTTYDVLNVEARYVRVTISGSTADTAKAGAYEIRILGNKYPEDNPPTSIVGVAGANTVPTEFALYQNYPNPFNPSTKLSYKISEAGKIKLTIYDVLGREVQTIVNEYQNAGKYEITWDASARHLASGTYIARINAGNYSKAIKLMLLK